MHWASVSISAILDGILGTSTLALSGEMMLRDRSGIGEISVARDCVMVNSSGGSTWASLLTVVPVPRSASSVSSSVIVATALDVGWDEVVSARLEQAHARSLQWSFLSSTLPKLIFGLRSFISSFENSPKTEPSLDRGH